MRDRFAFLPKDVCHDVEVEPHLQTLTGEALRTAVPTPLMKLVWMSVCAGKTCIFDIRVFNPFAKSHVNQKLDTPFTSNENWKTRLCNQTVIEVEHGSLTLLVFLPYGGSGAGHLTVNKIPATPGHLQTTTKLVSQRSMQMDATSHNIVACCWPTRLRPRSVCNGPKSLTPRGVLWGKKDRDDRRKS